MNDATDLKAPSEAAVRAQLGRILASADFAQSERLKAFLDFVVAESLAGRAERLKEYSIATEVFGRDKDFDPQTNTVVRVEAGRLRRRLERYYLTEGKADEVRIELPKGTYAPVFRSAQPVAPKQPPAATADRALQLPSGPSVAGPAVREPERRSRPGILRRRHHRGDHQRSDPLPGSAGDRAPLDLQVQG